MIGEISISDRLRLLGLAKEIRAVIFMHRQEEINEEKEEVSIIRYVEEIIEIAEKMAEWIMKDGEIIIAEIGSIAEIISTQGMEDKLSSLHVKPARVVTTHFPAVAGLPSDKRIRIYAKAVSGQEKEIILEAIT